MANEPMRIVRLPGGSESEVTPVAGVQIKADGSIKLLEGDLFASRWNSDVAIQMGDVLLLQGKQIGRTGWINFIHQTTPTI